MNDVYALIVGIDRYAEAGGDWNLKGPAENACAVAERLLDAGVPADRIHLFLSCTAEPPARLAVLAARGLKPDGEADWKTLDDFWRESLPEGDGTKLFVFWSGHGFSDEKQRRIFLCSDYKKSTNNRVFNADNFVDQMQRQRGRRFLSQRIFADVCGTYAGSIRLTAASDNNDPNDAPRSAETLDQLLYYASPDGEYALGKGGIGVFTSVLLAGAEPLSNWTDQAGLIGEMDRRFGAAGVPALLVTYGSARDKRRQALVGELPAAAAAGGIIAKALVCLAGLPASDAAIRSRFVATVGRAGRKDLSAAQGKYGMVAALADFVPDEAGKAPFFLAEFMIRLAKQWPTDALADWVERFAVDQNVEEIEEELALELPVRRLVVELTYDPNLIVSGYELTLRDGNLDPPPEPWTEKAAVAGWDALEETLGARIEAIAEECEAELEVDFLVDAALFEKPLHAIALPGGRTIGERFKCIVHYRHRRKWNRPWRDCYQAIRNTPFGQLKSLPIAADGSLPEEKGLYFAGFPLFGDRGCADEVRALDNAVTGGAPYLLWAHDRLADVGGELSGELSVLRDAAATIEKIPDELALRRSRRQGLSLKISLLWDDPGFAPFVMSQGPKK